MLLSERVAQTVRRREKRARISSKVGRVINNENAVYVKETSRKIEAEKMVAKIKKTKNRQQKDSWQKISCSFVFHEFLVLFFLHRLECGWFSACIASF